MNGRRVLLGVTGGIAAYKAAALASRLVQQGVVLDVVMTHDAERFVGAATFAALAQKHGLFPAGAMETINEWAFDRFEEPLLDEGDPIEIAHHLIRSSQVSMTSEQPV